jgi:hypothetical protein
MASVIYWNWCLAHNLTIPLNKLHRCQRTVAAIIQARVRRRTTCMCKICAQNLYMFIRTIDTVNINVFIWKMYINTWSQYAKSNNLVEHRQTTKSQIITTHSQTSSKHMVTTLYVFSQIFTYMCIFLYVYVYYAHAICTYVYVFFDVRTRVVFNRGPPTWCINLSTYGIGDLLELVPRMQAPPMATHRSCNHPSTQRSCDCQNRCSKTP